MSVQLSALVITYNEEDNIKEFLENISFADEIVIVDSYSTDKTIEIAKNHPKVRIIQREFDNFSSQKNFTIEQAKYDWAIFFDADERIDEKLKKEILDSIQKENSVEAYFIYRRFYFMNKHMKYSGWKNDKAIRLFKTKKCRYEVSKFVHETINCKGVNIGHLKNKLDHYSYTSFEEYSAKLDLYSRLRARELYKKGLRPNPFHFIIKPCFRFLHHYLFGLGFLDGKEGFIISRVYGFHVFRRYVYLWLLWKNNGELD